MSSRSYKRIVVAAATICFLSGFCFAQSKRINWSEGSNCGFATKPSADGIDCSRITTSSGTVRMIKTSELTVAVRLTSDEGFLILQMVLVNNGTKLIEFDSDRWEAAHFIALPVAQNTTTPLKTERSIPSRDLVRDIRNETADSLLLEKFMTESLIERRTDSAPIVENPRTQKITPVPTSSRGGRPVQEANKVDQERAQNMGVSSVVLSQAKQNEIRKYALIAKSIPAKGSLKGLVYFKRVKKAEAVDFRLLIGDTTYSFAMPYVNK